MFISEIIITFTSFIRFHPQYLHVEDLFLVFLQSILHGHAVTRFISLPLVVRTSDIPIINIDNNPS